MPRFDGRAALANNAADYDQRPIPRHVFARIAAGVAAFIAAGLAAQAQPADVPGSADHPLVSRYPESVIKWYLVENHRPYRIAVGPIAGYRRIDAYTPFPVEGLSEALRTGPSRLPLIVLIGGLVGCVGGYFMQYYAAAISYPLNVGGRPLHSWPAFIPVTFECTVLAAAFGAFIGNLLMNRLPQPYHPTFNVPGFLRASQDRFFLCVKSDDPMYSETKTRAFLEGLGAVEVSNVEK